MSLIQQEHQSSPLITTTSTPNHQLENQNNQQIPIPVVSQQSPQHQHNNRANQSNGSPLPNPQHQVHLPRHPTDNTGSPQQPIQKTYYHKHRDVEYKITAGDLKKFRVAFTAEIPDDMKIKSIDFSANGMDAMLNTKNIIKFIRLDPEGPRENFIKVAKYGAGICKFLNPYNRIIHTSTRCDDDIRLYHIKKNGYDTYFKGHCAEVTGLEVSPLWHVNFVSASKDNTVKFWDIRRENYVRSKTFKRCPIIACHPKDLQVAVAYATDKITYVIELYDFRKMEVDKAVSKFYFEDQEFQWKIMKFSKNGKYLMINTNNTLTIVINAETGTTCQRLHGKFTSPMYKSSKYQLIISISRLQQQILFSS